MPKDGQELIHRLPEIVKEGVFNQARLAERTGIPKSSISELCNGKKDLREDHIHKISKAMGVPAWHLFLDPETVPDKEHRKILKLYNEAPEHIQQSIRTLLGMED